MSHAIRHCGRCGLADDSVLDLDTGGAFHPELRHCITKLKQLLEDVTVTAVEVDKVFASPTPAAVRVRAVRDLLRVVHIAKAREIGK